MVRKKLELALLIVIVIAPRLVRMGYHKIWVEDPNYICAAYLITQGAAPYRDFAQPNLPALEQLLALLYRSIAPSYRIPEALTALATALTAFILFKIASSLWSNTAGFVAALLYSFHPLLFRYHLFDREPFVALFGTYAFWLLLVYRGSRLKTALGLAACFTAGFACKQTMAVVMLTVGCYLLLQRRLKLLAITVASSFAGVSLLIGGYYALYGKSFICESLIFHFIKGQAAPIPVKMAWFLEGLTFIMPLGLWGLMHMVLRRRPEALLFGPAIAFEFVFDAVISATLWPHYLIPALLPLSLTGGWAVHSARSDGARSSALRVARTGLIVSMIASCGWFIAVYVETAASAAESLGFGGEERTDLVRLSEAMQRLTSPGSTIIAPPFEAFLSRRYNLINFYDNLGVMMALERAVNEGTFREFNRAMAHFTFAEIRRDSSREWLPLVVEAIKSGKAAAVIPSYELPLDVKFLENNKYRRAYHDETYEVWARERTE